MTYLSVLTIAGSDSSGGAGIQADLKTIASFGCYGLSVITALTAQNTTGVQGVQPCPPTFVEQQMLSVLEDIKIDSIKTGMLYDDKTVQAVVRVLKTRFSGNVPPIVCDPVCVSTSGDRLLHPDALGVMIRDLLPLAALITPNKSEAEALLSYQGHSLTITSIEDLISASNNLLEYGCRAVLLKGGHFTATLADVDRVVRKFPTIAVVRYALPLENTEILQASGKASPIDRVVVDALCQNNGDVTLYVRPHVNSKNVHGTGCTLSSALACELARGVDIVEATRAATAYVYHGIITASPIGRGNGPLNHFHSIVKSSLNKPTRMDPYPFIRYMIENSTSLWKAYVQHDFVLQLGEGTLDSKSFVHFVKQDYHYLRYYARAYGLIAAKSSELSSISDAAEAAIDVIKEIANHKMFCRQFGVTSEELESTPESTTTTAYGAYILDMGLQGDSMKLLMAVIACLIGYGEVGLWLKGEASREGTRVMLDNNPYRAWIDTYSGAHYQAAVMKGLDGIEARVAADPPSSTRLQDWLSVWKKCTELEKSFWDMAMNLS
ncbi:hypothetical protein AX17_001891 [Amanita inopinata Kibby_2008]|nr:hypothetical protein AX17_001891 [Amanita inopinata Kibby_2008]